MQTSDLGISVHRLMDVNLFDFPQDERRGSDDNYYVQHRRRDNSGLPSHYRKSMPSHVLEAHEDSNMSNKGNVISVTIFNLWEWNRRISATRSCLKKCNKVVRATVHKFAYIKTIECNNVVSSSIGFARSSWNFVKRYDLVALSKIIAYAWYWYSQTCFCGH